jgi:polyphenol oxidase
MRWLAQNGLRYLQFPALAVLPHYFHAIFLRDADPSQGAGIPFNLGLGCGTSDALVWANRQRMLSHWGNPTGVFARQVHGVEVGIWEADEEKQPRKNTVQLNGDALITHRSLSALVIQVADCQPVILIDPVRQAVANVHSGWRGSIQNIIGHTIAAMTSRFGSRPADLMAGIGPSLGPCCAEFINYRQELPESCWRYRMPGDRFNFWQLSVDQLSMAGVLAHHISVAGICTKCNPHLFFSYRAEQQTGRFASIVGIKA